MELGGGARLFLQSLLHSHSASVLLAFRDGLHVEMVQLLAGTNLALLAFSVLIFRHSSLYAVAPFVGFVRRVETQR